MTMTDFLRMIAESQAPQLRARLLKHLSAFADHKDLQRCHDDYERDMLRELA